MKATTQANLILTDIPPAQRRVLALLRQHRDASRSPHDPTAVRRLLLLADMLTDQAERIVRFRDSRL